MERKLTKLRNRIWRQNLTQSNNGNMFTIGETYKSTNEEKSWSNVYCVVTNPSNPRKYAETQQKQRRENKKNVW